VKKNPFVKAVVSELKLGESVLSNLSYSVTFFGSARISQGNENYKIAKELSGRLSKLGVNVITGGGPGLMEAANRGAFESAGSESIGLNIILEHEQVLNPYVTKSAEFSNFFTRKLMLRKYSSAFIVFPGGFGTLDELMEILTLIQTGKMKNRKVFLYSSEFYLPLLDFMKKSMLSSNMIVEGDFNIFQVVDNVGEIIESISRHKECLCERND
jgi:uncharacterized protein (TIGR00730 family)